MEGRRGTANRRDKRVPVRAWKCRARGERETKGRVSRDSKPPWQAQKEIDGKAPKKEKNGRGRGRLSRTGTALQGDRRGKQLEGRE